MIEDVRDVAAALEEAGAVLARVVAWCYENDAEGLPAAIDALYGATETVAGARAALEGLTTTKEA